MPRYRKPHEYGRLETARQNFKNIAKDLGIDLKAVFAEADKVKQLAPPAAPPTPIPDAQPAVPAFSTPPPVVEPEPATPPAQFELGPATGNFGQEILFPTQQPVLDVGYSGSGLPKAERHEGVPADAKYYIDLCIICSTKMYTRDPREDCCENCCYLLRDESTTARVSMESKAGGKLVNPFSED
jgi:hypothetical protein